ncbi:B3/B4 domain-containing protein [Pelistega europaea]|uniref:B3/B4 tRNA-binding domain-containing protein n=1 Tax=Pelistega europaea TaxID=106147 RepID=A0A7Y4LAK4_9BURK|nr:phenylalanine--tRNA ligase beta subunit-related protein [Pelistega europaea]NOL49982.1 hypothetical protein [Pelistega europaea]
MITLKPIISPEIFQLAPDFKAISINVQAGPVVDAEVGATALRQACADYLQTPPAWAEAHLQSWATVFQQFGAKPKRTPCSAAALIKRVQKDGILSSIDPIVDLYNAVSIRYAIPVGGENSLAYVGVPQLGFASGKEIFDTVKEGVAAIENPEVGEVIWHDNQGVTCRRWNWRQGTRTRLSIDNSAMWFILESLGTLPVAELESAAAMLTSGIRAMMPAAIIQQDYIDAQTA